MANGKAAISQYFSNLIGEALKQYDCFYIDKYERLDKQNISTEHIDSAFLIKSNLERSFRWFQIIQSPEGILRINQQLNKK